MSHFSLLVVLDDFSDLEAALAPFCEQDEQFYEWEDEHDEIVDTYNKQEAAYKLPDGRFVSTSDKPKEWWVDAKEEEYNAAREANQYRMVKREYNAETKKYSYFKAVIPEDVELVQVSTKFLWEEVEGKDFDEWVEDYYGYDRETHLRGDRWGSLHNPNAKWDWYQVGGRWSGMLQIKGSDSLSNKITDPEIIIGERSWTNQGEEIKGIDGCRVKHLDLEKIERMNAEYFAENYDKRKLELSEEVFTQLYGNKTKEEYVDENKRFSTFAVLMDGEWHEKGNMGWFGISVNNNEDWEANFQDLFSSIDPQKWVVVVDCHI